MLRAASSGLGPSPDPFCPLHEAVCLLSAAAESACMAKNLHSSLAMKIFSSFGALGNFMIGVSGAILGVSIASRLPMFTSTSSGVQNANVWGLLVVAAAGSFILLFVANIAHVVWGPYWTQRKRKN